MLTQLRRFFGDENEKALKRVSNIVPVINALEPEIEVLSDTALAAKTDEFRTRLDAGETLDDILPEAFAVVREAAKRTVGLRHFDVQLMGGVILHEGNISEMRTGEGKTLVATLPVYLNALSGKGVHVVTVNDYLARRDAVWMGQVYAFLGMHIGVVNGENQSFIYDPGHVDEDAARDAEGYYKVKYDFLRPGTRTEAYAADITYGTNNEFGFDYLRDNLSYEAGQLRQRGQAFAIVDEIDSVLIDEARTPLIIAAPAAESENLYHLFANIAGQLKQEEHFTVEEKTKSIQMTDAGIEQAEKLLGIDNIYTEKGIKYVHHLETAVRAKALFTNDKEYVVRDGEVVIVDEFTGRLQPGRRWSEGLHQAIEAKEGLAVQRESRTFASVTFQNYFRMYEKLAGMTGTAQTSSEEFHTVYGLQVVSIPTNVETQRTDRGDLIFQTEAGKFKAISRRVQELHEKGQPVLIGTVSIEKNEMLSAYLKKDGVPHDLLNAKQHEQEGEVIAEAGKRGRVTIATNMAGRGVDIKLGGTDASTEEYEAVKTLGGLFVLGTERHEARRIDNQLRGRAGRQGDPGETQFFVSMEDSLMRVFASDTVKNMMGRFGIPEDEPIENRMVGRALETAQSRIEGFNFDARKQILAYDNVLNQQRQTVYARRMRLLQGDTEEVQAELTAIAAGDETLRTTINEKREALGDDEFAAAVRRLMLQTIDTFWVEHLEIMEYTRSSVNLRAYGQRDPLIEYKKEGLRLFQEMEEAVADQICKLVPQIQTGAFQGDDPEKKHLQEVHKTAQTIGGGSSTSDSEKTSVGRPDNRTIAATGRKFGRNELVTITNGSETEEMKYKRAEQFLATGEWRIVEK